MQDGSVSAASQSNPKDFLKMVGIPRSARDFRKLADQMFPRELQSIQIAQHGNRDLVRTEEEVSHLCYLFGPDGFDLVDGFVEAEEALEVHLLAGKVGHA